jgi:hypothetical protein
MLNFGVPIGEGRGISKRKSPQIGDHALPQRGFGLSTPSGAERKGATPCNTRHRRKRKSRQRAMHELRSEHTRARRHSVIRHRSSNQENKGGNHGTDSITPGAGTALQEGERIQEPGHAMRANQVGIKGVHSFPIMVLRSARSKERLGTQTKHAPIYVMFKGRQKDFSYKIGRLRRKTRRIDGDGPFS